jgi:hypothetical protein
MLAIQHLLPGARLKLTDGALVEVVENPHDGAWIMIRRVLDGESDPMELCSVDDIVSLVE